MTVPVETPTNQEFVEFLKNGRDKENDGRQARKLTAREWQTVLTEPLGWFTNCLPQLAGFRGIKELVSTPFLYAGDQVKTPIENLVVPQGIGLGTRCLTINMWPRKKTESKGASLNLRMQTLLLTRKAAWVWWDAQYDIIGIEGDIASHYQATSSQFEFIDQGDLIQTMVERVGEPAYDTVSSFFRAMAGQIGYARNKQLRDARTLSLVGERILVITDERLDLDLKGTIFPDQPR